MVKSNIRKKYYRKKELVLNNTYAKRIYDLYQKNPQSIALSADQVKDLIKARVSRGTIIYHLNKLKHYGFIPSHKITKKKIQDNYFILKKKPKISSGFENVKKIVSFGSKMILRVGYSKSSVKLLIKDSKMTSQQVHYFLNSSDTPQLYLTCLYDLLLKIKSILDREEASKELTVKDFVSIYDKKISKIENFKILFLFDDCLNDPESLKYTKELVMIEKLIINLFFGFELDTDDLIVFDYFKVVRIDLFVKLRLYSEQKCTKEEVVNILNTADT